MDNSTTDNRVALSYKNNRDMVATVKNADSVAYLNGYATVTFIITTGNESFNARLEMGMSGEGVAIIDSITTGTTTASYTSADEVKSRFNDGYDYKISTESTSEKIYYYASEADVGKEDLRLKDEDGNVRYDEGKVTAVLAFGYVIRKDGTEGGKLLQYYRFDTDDLYVIEEPEVEEDEEDESVEESTPAGDENLAWLQISSIVIAAVLVAALVAVIVRKFLAGKVSKKKKTEKYYHQGYNKNSRYSKGDVSVPDAEDGDYNYDEE